MSGLMELSGARFGRLRVLRRQVGAVPVAWECVCDCGTVVVKRAKALRRGETRSCGCLRREVAGAASRRHAMSGTRTYGAWQHMWARCTNARNKDYHRYGGRGIGVCEAWTVFDAFLRDMGIAPEGLTLDRKNPDGNYSPENCRWATRLEQARNKSRFKGDGRRVGVTWDAKTKRWRARVTGDSGTRVPLGHFKAYEDAVAAVDSGIGRYVERAASCAARAAG